MNLSTRCALATAILFSASLSAVADSYSWMTPGNSSRNGVYTTNWNGWFDSKWMEQNSWYDANSLPGSASAMLGSDRVAVVIDPAADAYNLAAVNADIAGVILVSVTSSSVTYTGAAWVNTKQVGTLNLYVRLNRLGLFNAFTAGPGTLASASSPDYSGVPGDSAFDAVASVGTFNPAIDTLAIAPILVPIDPTQQFGVVISPVPEPSAIAAMLTGLTGLWGAARLRRRV